MGHVLIIEDAMLIAMHLESLIAGIAGVTTDIAGTQAEAVAMAQGQRPCLIVSDVRLATGTGPAAVAEIRESVGAVPVLYVTGNPDRIADGSPVLTKPVRDHELIAAAREMLADRRPDGAKPAV